MSTDVGSGTGLPAAPDTPNTAEPEGPERPEVPWQRLDPRMILVRPTVDVIRSLPLLVGSVFLGGVNSVWQWLGLGVTGLAVLISIGHCLTARYRITDEQMELRTGIVHRRHRSVPRDRIRTVDVTAELKHRLFGLTAVKIGTGRHTKDASDELVLDAVSVTEAGRLSRLLLNRLDNAESSTDGVGGDTDVLLELDRRWARYAPCSLTGLTTIAAAIGVVLHFAHEAQLDLTEVGPLHWLITRFEAASWAVAVPVAVVGLLAVAAVLSVPGYLLAYGGFRLTRTGASLRVQRGMVTTRSVTIEEERLRGVAVHEVLPMRMAGGARATAVASGLLTLRGGSVLIPPAPADRVHTTLAAVLQEEHDPTSVVPERHPAAALRRRLLRAVVGVAVVTGLLWALSRFGVVPDWAWQPAPLLAPFTVAVAVGCYRNLGHALIERYLVVRRGFLRRTTVALRRDAVVGWRLERTFFQRRAGLVTLVPTLAAGRGAYPLPDLALPDALAVVDETVPGLLTPFLATDEPPRA